MKRRELLELLPLLFVFYLFYPLIWLADKIDDWLDKDVKWCKK